VTCADVRDLLPALSLDALDLDERDALEDHLARCPDCRSEFRSYQETATRLALAFPQHEPPSGLKRRVLAAAATRPQRTRLAPWWRRLGFGFPRLQPAPVVAALALVVALSTTLWAAGLQMQLNEQRVLAAGLKERAYRYDKVVAVLQSPEMQLRPMQGTELAPTATGRIYVDPENGSGMMMVRSLPRLPEGRVYQLWWARADGKRESGGVLTWTDPYGNGYTLITCPGPFNTWQTFGLTEEPAGGSPAPTGQRVISGRI
jgi:anti-sigma-K factor RskA